MNRIHKNNGFTIVELMLAMGFVSALLLAIAMTVIQIGNIYNRGITFKNVDQIGGSIANEVQRGISGGTSFDAPGQDYIEGGRLCTGEYSYVWNFGNNINADTEINRYSSTDSNTPIRFVKVHDTSKFVCIKVGAIYPSIDKSSSIEMIDGGQFDLAIQDFSIVSYPTGMDAATRQQLYAIQFYIGTNEQGTLENEGHSCALSGLGANPVYCSVERFNITVRAGSETTNAKEK